jgi:hypothetical protein
MKAKTTVMVALVFLFVTVTFLGEVSADHRWRRCTVEAAGWHKGYVKITLLRIDKTDPRVFVAKAGEENRMLAIALAAMMSTGMQVKAEIDWSQNEDNIIEGLICLP